MVTLTLLWTAALTHAVIVYTGTCEMEYIAMIVSK